MATRQQKQLAGTIALTVCLIIGHFVVRPNPAPQAFSAAILSRSHLSPGDPTRVQHAMAKARRGEQITIGFFGGSITNGEGASSPDHSYSSLVSRWWAQHFPKSQINIVNAGVNGTGSGYGVFRLQRDLLSKHPDFVVVEFGVNDHGDLAHAETYEGIIRQLMVDPDQPAVLLLFLMHHDGTNAQDFQGEIGKQYGLPMVSYRDALWPEIQAGRLKWTDITADAIHPNDRGHAAAAAFVNSLLQETLDRLPTGNLPPIPITLPATKYTDLFANPELIDADKLQPVVNNGWIYDHRNNCWASSLPGSAIEFESTGRAVDLLYERFTPDAGTIRTTFDEQPSKIFDGWFDGTWAGYCQADELGRDLEGGSHRVRVELIATRNPTSRGYAFRILGLGAAK